ncbi:DUF86 domain-containing protein [Patescibacteria group bacterium]|nr:DUF86 domain-containing protein [Patescibacteria group bacterium]MBU4512499.1 DUF86 domain-containing protein [Patescibacteria group bacterium]MCG2693522.1 DUF86 domain-containing protein [Candidatus Parcubacteria bacterium]
MREKDKLNLISILEALDKIQKFTEVLDNADDFYNDKRNFDASVMNFVVIGEMVSRLSKEFKREYNYIDWSKIKDFRNIIAHDYFGIDAEEVWQIIKNDLPGLKKEIKKIINP